MCTTTPRHPLDYDHAFDRHMSPTAQVLPLFERLAYVTISLESRVIDSDQPTIIHSFSTGLNQTAAPTNSSQLTDYARVGDIHSPSPDARAGRAALPARRPKRVTTQPDKYVYAIELWCVCR